MKLTDFVKNFLKSEKKSPIEYEKERAIKFMQRYREKYIPEQYNQALLAEQILNPDIDWLVSISNRTDGKSFNYLGMYMALCIEFDVGFFLIARHFTLRNVYYNTLLKIASAVDYFDPVKFSVQSTQFYLIVIYDNKVIGIISDLNAATDLKYSSAFVVDFPIIIYDEFLALESDYLPDEPERLKTIFESVNRDFFESDTRILQEPVIVLLGNAVNFSSPLLSYLDLFNKLERQGLNTARQYGNIWMEMRKNEHSNEKRNLRAFPEDDDPMTTGQFKFNNFGLATDNDRNAIIAGVYHDFYIKLIDRYLKVRYNIGRNLILLSVVANAPDYQFCTELKDMKDGVQFLKESYYDENQYKKHEREFYKYDNAYTKEYLTSQLNYVDIKILKCINQYDSQKPIETTNERHEREYKNQYMENSILAIQRRFFM